MVTENPWYIFVQGGSTSSIWVHKELSRRAGGRSVAQQIVVAPPAQRSIHHQQSVVDSFSKVWYLELAELPRYV